MLIQMKWVKILILLVVTMLTLVGANVASAQVPQSCRDLAKQFSEAPEKLAKDKLVELRKCVGREVRRLSGGEAGQKRKESGGESPAPSQPQVKPQTQPQSQPSTTPSR